MLVLEWLAEVSGSDI